MKICQRHWDELRKAIDARGLSHLVKKSGQEAIAQLATELEGRGAENILDPLMGANNMIWSKGLEVLGLSLMTGYEKCPVCEAVSSYERWWIDGPADAMLKQAKEDGLV